MTMYQCTSCNMTIYQCHVIWQYNNMTIYQCHAIWQWQIINSILANATTNQLSVTPHLSLNGKVNELKGNKQTKTVVKLFC